MNISLYQKELKGKSAQEVVAWSLEHFSTDKIAFASSFGAEDQVLTDMILKNNPQAQIFSLDTGRLPQETYDVIDATRKHYHVNIEILFPEQKKVEDLIKKEGPNSFYQSVEQRKYCCQIRKVDSLKKKLNQLDAWMTGLRQEQSVTRSDLHLIEWDESNQLIKINPLANWKESEVWEYIKKNQVPYNSLHDKGYPSIGCSPCTRAIEPHEDIRAGRWWWENPESKECGLHFKDGKLIRSKNAN